MLSLITLAFLHAALIHRRSELPGSEQSSAEHAKISILDARDRGSAGGRPATFDPDTHQWRHAVECAINLPERCQVVAIRLDEPAIRFETTAHATVSDVRLRALVKKLLERDPGRARRRST